MSVLVSVVNFRTPQLTIGCLRSLAGELEQVPGMQVVVADNASGDGSGEMIAAAIEGQGWGRWASLLQLPRNGGFSYGNNRAIERHLGSDLPPDYVLLLNPDTFIRPGAVRELLAFMRDNPRVGIAGSRMENPDGTVRRTAFRFPTAARELVGMLGLGPVSRLFPKLEIAPPAPTTACATDWVCGASMMIQKGVFDSVGLLDEDYFLYYEELDLCLQARRAGWECWYVPSSRVVHLVGQASGVTAEDRAPHRRPSYWFDSRHRYFLKNYGPRAALVADVCWISGGATRLLMNTLRRRPRQDPPRFLRDFVRHGLEKWSAHL